MHSFLYVLCITTTAMQKTACFLVGAKVKRADQTIPTLKKRIVWFFPSPEGYSSSSRLLFFGYPQNTSIFQKNRISKINPVEKYQQLEKIIFVIAYKM